MKIDAKQLESNDVTTGQVDRSVYTVTSPPI